MRFACGEPVITDEDVEAVAQAARSGWLVSGPRTRAFEDALSSLYGEATVLGVSSGTAALAIGLLCSGVKVNSEVITSVLTFTATCNAIAAIGAKPVFCDVTSDGSTLDPELVADAISERTRAILPVSMGGLPTDTATLGELARPHEISLMEDAAYALGSRHADLRAPSPECLLAISFHPTKLITAGSGGALVGLDQPRLERAQVVRQQGVSRSSWARHVGPTGAGYSVVSAGFALEMGDMNAALGHSQLTRLSETVARRRSLFTMMSEMLGEGPWTLPALDGPYGLGNGSMYRVLLSDASRRDEVRIRLADSGIGTAVHYPLLSNQPAWSHCRRYTKSFSIAASISDRTITLPVTNGRTESELECIADAFRAAVASCTATRRRRVQHVPQSRHL